MTADLLALPVLWQLLILTVAAWWVTRLVVVADFPPTVWLRETVWSRWPADDTLYPDDGVVIPDPDLPTEGVVNGRVAVDWDDGLELWRPIRPRAFGNLISCPWCVSPYVTAVVVAVWVLWPASLWLWLVLTMAGVEALIATRVDR